ncbi:MAG TPA: septal ring lytic transglycosylase RlpA family protein [Stellaceae bacterium]
MTRSRACAAAAFIVLLSAAVAVPVSARGAAGEAAATKAKPKVERGLASWYGSKLHGHKTASGEPMDRQKLTAAHRKLPFGTVVEVTNKRNGRKVYVTITDRGPGKRSRIIDVSPVAAAQLGMKKKGVTPVEVRPATFE